MDRRQFLAIGALSAFSGCASLTDSDSGPTAQPETSRSTDSSDSSETDSPTETEPDITRNTLEIAEPATLGPLEVTVTDSAVARRVVGADTEIVAESGILVLARISVQNVGSDTVPFPSASAFSALSGTQQFDVLQNLDNSGVMSSTLSEIEEPVSGSVYAGRDDAHPDVQETGWLGFELPADFSRVELACSASPHPLTEYEPAYWLLPVSADSAPVLSLDGVNAPDTISYGDVATFEVAVSNSGGAEGTLTRDYQVGDMSNLYGYNEGEVSITVAPGETATETIDYAPERLETVTLELGDDKYSVDVEPAALSWGESLTTPGGVEISVSEPTISESYQLEDGDQTSELSDSAYAFAQFYARNTSDEASSPPILRLDASSEQFNVRSAPGWGTSTTTLTEPVSGKWISLPMSYEADEERDGWVAFEVDSGISADKTSIVLDDPKGVVAEWS